MQKKHCDAATFLQYAVHKQTAYSSVDILMLKMLMLTLLVTALLNKLLLSLETGAGVKMNHAKQLTLHQMGKFNFGKAHSGYL